MLHCKINDNKIFMSSLLKNNIFDTLELREITIKTFATFIISGETTNEQTNSYNLWETIKPYAYNIIKGNVTPKYIKIVFSIPKEAALEIHENASALFLNFIYSDAETILITGSSEKNFSLSKEVDLTFDDYVEKFLKTNDIVFEEIE